MTATPSWAVRVAAARVTLAGDLTIAQAVSDYGISHGSITDYRRLLIWAPDLAPLVEAGQLPPYPAIHEAMRRKRGNVPVCAACYASRWRAYEQRAAIRRGPARGCQHTNPGRWSASRWRREAPPGPWSPVLSLIP